MIERGLFTQLSFFIQKLLGRFNRKPLFCKPERKSIILYVEVLKELDTSSFDGDGNVCLFVVCECAGTESSETTHLHTHWLSDSQLDICAVVVDILQDQSS